MTAWHLVAVVQSVGGELVPDGDRLHVSLPAEYRHLLGPLREHKAEVMNLLRQWVSIPVACRCSAKPYAHIHSLADRCEAVREWNRDSKHKFVEPIQ